MKSMIVSAEISTPRFWFAFEDKDIERAARHIGKYPLIVKPYNGGNCEGISTASKVETIEEFFKSAMKTIDVHGGALKEEFIEGREFTVLIFENPDDGYEPIVLQPVEFLFPAGMHFSQ